MPRRVSHSAFGPRRRTPGSGSPLCQGRGFALLECAPTLVAVKVVRPVGRSTLTAPARRRDGRGAEPARGFVAAGCAGGVGGAGWGSGLSEEPMTGVDRSAALDLEDPPECPSRARLKLHCGAQPVEVFTQLLEQAWAQRPRSAGWPGRRTPTGAAPTTAASDPTAASPTTRGGRSRPWWVGEIATAARTPGSGG